MALFDNEKTNKRKKMRPSKAQSWANEKVDDAAGAAVSAVKSTPSFKAGARAAKAVGKPLKKARDVVSKDMRDTKSHVRSRKPPKVQDPQKRIFSDLPNQPKPQRGTAQAAEKPDPKKLRKGLLDKGQKNYSAADFDKDKWDKDQLQERWDTATGKIADAYGIDKERVGVKDDRVNIRTGNMDVNFADGTPVSERRAFLRDPVNGGTRRRSNLPGKQYGDASARRFAPPQQQQQMERPELNTFSDVMRYKADMATQRLNNDSMDTQTNRFQAVTGAQNDAFSNQSQDSLRQAQSGYYGARAEGARAGADKASAETDMITRSNDLFSEWQNAETPEERQQLKSDYLASIGEVEGDNSQEWLREEQMNLAEMYNDARNEFQANNLEGEFMPQQEWARQTLPESVYSRHFGEVQERPQPDPEDIRAALKDKKARKDFIDYFGAEPENFR